MIVSTGIFTKGKDKYDNSRPVKLKQSLHTDLSSTNEIKLELDLKESNCSEIQIVADASSAGDLQSEGMYEVE